MADQVLPNSSAVSTTCIDSLKKNFSWLLSNAQADTIVGTTLILPAPSKCPCAVHDIDALILEIIDSTTGCIAQEIEFSGSDMLTLLALLKIKNFDFFGVSYDLEESDVKAVQQTFGWKNVYASAACLHVRDV